MVSCVFFLGSANSKEFRLKKFLSITVLACLALGMVGLAKISPAVSNEDTESAVLALDPHIVPPANFNPNIPPNTGKMLDGGTGYTPLCDGDPGPFILIPGSEDLFNWPDTVTLDDCPTLQHRSASCLAQMKQNFGNDVTSGDNSYRLGVCDCKSKHPDTNSAEYHSCVAAYGEAFETWITFLQSQYKTETQNACPCAYFP